MFPFSWISFACSGFPLDHHLSWIPCTGKLSFCLGQHLSVSKWMGDLMCSWWRFHCAGDLAKTAWSANTCFETWMHQMDFTLELGFDLFLWPMSPRSHHFSQKCWIKSFGLWYQLVVDFYPPFSLLLKTKNDAFLCLQSFYHFDRFSVCIFLLCRMNQTQVF